MMKRILALSTALIMALSLAACGGNNTNEESSSDTLTGKVATGGSTSMEKVIGVLQESYMEQNSGVDITYDPTGSSAGITGVQEGTLDIGLSSRALKESETGVVGTVVALDGIAIVVNNANPVSDLTLEQIAQIASGEVTNWKDFGGEDGEIVLIGREAGSGTRDGFESIVGVKECVYQQELTATGAVIAAVSANPNAIGYASLSAVNDTIKALTVEGVAPSEATVQNGTYKIQRPFVFVTKEGANQSDVVKAFLEYATSKEVAELIVKAGAVPVAK